MKRFKSIAVLLDEIGTNERILTRAVELAKHNKASLSVYSVFEKPRYVPDTGTELYPRGDVLGQLEQAKEQKRTAAVEPFQESGVAIAGGLLIGKPFVRMIQEVQKNGHDLLMLPAEKGGGGLGLFLGGTPVHLLRKCPCAVWVFREQRQPRFRSIAAAINVATRHREEIELNIKIMELSISLAQQENAVLHIITCWTVFAETLLANSGNLSEEQRSTYVRNSKKEHRDLLNTLLQEFSIDADRTHIHLPKGYAGDRIPEVASRYKVELLVMGTVARSGLAGFYIGNCAEKILNHVPCSVLAVKPNGFVSPVKPERS